MKIITESSITTRDIIVRQDTEANSDIEQHAALYYPLILLGEDTVLNASDLLSFSLEYGKSILPKISFSFIDENVNINDRYTKESHQLITVRISNNMDGVNRPMKSDYLIESIDTSPTSRRVHITASLYFSGLYVRNNRAFFGTSKAVLENISDITGLGFATNIADTNDSQDWIQRNTLLELFEYINLYSFSTDMDVIKCYIDPYLNICLVSLQNTLNNTTDKQITTDLYTGETLDTPQNLLLSNNRMYDKDTSDFMRLDKCRISNNIGKVAKEFTEFFSYCVRDLQGGIMVEGLLKSDRCKRGGIHLHSTVESTNKFPLQQLVPTIDKRNKALMLASNTIKCELELYTPFIRLFDNVKVDIYTYTKGSVYSQQETTQTEETLQAAQIKQNVYSKNVKMSGRYVVSGIEYIYRKNILKPLLILTQKENE